MRTLRTLGITALVAVVVTACGSSSDSDDEPTSTPTASSSPSTAAPSPAPSASATPSPAPSSPAPSTPTADPATSEPPTPTVAALFPGHKVQQLDDSVIANRESYGNGWPWKTSDVVMACGDSIGGGAYLNAADGENYLLTGTITQQGFVKGNAGTELWNGKDGDAYAEWLDAGAKLCPDAA